AAAEGIALRITSGWRSKGFQERLFDDAVRTYGSADIARQFVASPEVSKHVVGQAVDVAPVDADKWLIRNGAQFGLCQIYANELWHFELAVDALGNCPPLRPNAAGEGPHAGAGKLLGENRTTAKPRPISAAPTHGRDHSPAIGSSAAPMAAPPAMPRLAVAFIQAPARSGGIACVRTAHV